MKKIFTLLVLMSALAVNAQSFKLFYESDELHNNDTIQVLLDGHSDEINTYVGYQNLLDSAITIRVSKQLLLINEETTDIVFCIGECYTGNLSAPVTVDANTTVPANNPNAFHSSYVGGTDPALVKYRFYRDDISGEDEVTFYISYTDGTGVRAEDMVKTLSAYPNPASRLVNIDYAAPSANAYLVIKNLTGREVYRTPVSQTGKKQIDISRFNSGVYFYGIESDGKMLCTKKLLVK